VRPTSGSTRWIAATTLVGLEAGHIRAVLENTNWRIGGSGGAAVSIDPTWLFLSLVAL